MRFVRLVSGAFVCVGLLLAVVVVVVRLAPQWLDDTTGLTSGAELAAERGRVRSGVLALLAGSLAAIGALYTSRTFALNRRGQATERFTRAVDQLASDKPDVRLGGIYALEQLARDSEREHEAIMEVLTAFIRRRAAPPRDLAREKPLEVDVQAALTVLNRRPHGRDAAFDLSRTNLRGAHLEGIVLRNARLSKARLDDAVLSDADLRGAGLIEAHLTRATLIGADLRQAKLRAAFLGEANLSEARLDGADLQGAIFDELTMWPDGFDPGAAGARPAASTPPQPVPRDRPLPGTARGRRAAAG